MQPVHFGRKRYSFGHGAIVLTSVSVTEKPISGEDEAKFVDRLHVKYGSREGTIEIVIKQGRPSHAIITFS